MPSKQAQQNKHKELRDFVRANYPESAVVVAFGASSEYNDEGYDNSITSATVRDRDGAEVIPNKGFSFLAEHSKYLMGVGYNLPGMDADYAPDLTGDHYVLIGA